MLYGTVTGVCEGQFFEWLGDAIRVTQKIFLEQTTSVLAGVAIYVTQLGKKILAQVAKRTCFFSF
jgi:hypothetical protein